MQYTYGLQFRPAGYATVPQGYVSAQPHPDFPRFGTVSYARPLSADEIKSFELTRLVTDQAEVAVIMDYIADKMSSGGDPEYAANWLEDIIDDPRYAESVVGQYIDQRQVHLPVGRADVLAGVVERLTKKTHTR